MAETARKGLRKLVPLLLAVVEPVVVSLTAVPRARTVESVSGALERQYALVAGCRRMVADAASGVSASVAAVRDAVAAGDLALADERLQLAGRFHRAAVAWTHEAGDLAMKDTGGGRGPGGVDSETAERFVAVVFAEANAAYEMARKAERQVDEAARTVGAAEQEVRVPVPT